MNIMSMAPITASQFGTARLVQQLMLGKADGDLTDAQRFISAATAGATSALIASPSELIIIQQQVSCLRTVWKSLVRGLARYRALHTHAECDEHVCVCVCVYTCVLTAYRE